MTISTILYIALALFGALGFAFFQYLFKKKSKKPRDFIFFGLRALSIFIVSLLLINPKINRTTYQLEKPQLLLLIDNSESIRFLESADEISDFHKNLAGDKELQKRFEISSLYFGRNLLTKDSLNFSAAGTDVYQSLSEASEILKNKNAAIILLSDANQTSGRDFRYYKKAANTQVFPVVIGDTTKYQDLSISRINSNRYAFLNNNFPVEVFVNYNGELPVTSEFQILQNGKAEYSEKLTFDSENRTKVVTTNIPVNSLGVKAYKARIKTLANEKNTTNNEQNFAVQVIDERTKVLLLSAIEHPDIGAIKKAIESNPQRSVDAKTIDDSNIQLKEYQLIIIYQLNNRFKKYLTEIIDGKQNFFLITGTETNWNYLNSLSLGINKQMAGPPQEIFPVYNDKFGTFQFDDIGFDDFPPLSEKFGKLDYNTGAFDVLLYQQMQGVKTDEPLLAISETKPKFGFLLGEGIWRWRAKSFRETQSFREFDDFFNKIVQNLASSKKRERLSLDYDNFYYGNEEVVITAQYYDENYQLDLEGDLQIKLQDSLNEKNISSDFNVKDNFYQFNAGDLPAGNYQFSVTEKNSGLSTSGSFEVIQYSTEQQFSSSNLQAMQDFAENNEATVYFPDQVEKLKNELLNNSVLKPLRKAQQKSVSLIDWYYLLFLLIFILAVEWFYRKYLGLI